MTITNQLKNMLGGALGVVGMIESLLHGGKEGAAAVAQPAVGKGTGNKKPPVAKERAKEAKAEHSAVARKKKGSKPAAARKATPPPVEAKGVKAAPAKRVKQAAASVSVKGGKKAAAGSAARG